MAAIDWAKERAGLEALRRHSQCRHQAIPTDAARQIF